MEQLVNHISSAERSNCNQNGDMRMHKIFEEYRQNNISLSIKKFSLFSLPYFQRWQRIERGGKKSESKIIFAIILLPIIPLTTALHSEKLAVFANGTKTASPPSAFQSPLKHLGAEWSENPLFRRVSKEVESFHTLNPILIEMETRATLPKSLNSCITSKWMLNSALLKKECGHVLVLY